MLCLLENGGFLTSAWEFSIAGQLVITHIILEKCGVFFFWPSMTTISTSKIFRVFWVQKHFIY
jgi:hypothetical protein